MEELKIDNTELNKNLLLDADKKDPDQLPEENQEQKAIIPEELPRDPAGNVLIEQIAIGKDDKGRYIVSDALFDRYYKELPDGTGNESKTFKAYNGGKIKTLTPDDKHIQRAGGEALQAKYKERRTFAEVIEEMLAQPANKEIAADLNLKTGATNLDMVIAAALKQSGRGNVKAMDFLRDTIGQKPTEKLDAAITGLTPEDKELLQNVSNRLGQ